MGVTTIAYTAAAHRSAVLALFESNVGGTFHAGERADFAAFLDALPGPYFVSLEGGAVVAAGGWTEEAAEPGLAAICWIMVDRGAQGQGLGTALQAHLVADATSRGFSTLRLETVPDTVGFFQRLGFIVVGEDPDGYGPGMPRVEMRRGPPR